MAGDDLAPPPRRRSRVPLLLVLVAFAVLGAILVRHYHARHAGEGSAGVPLLRADTSPVRERPGDPGGMAVPYRDVLVLHELGVLPNEAAEPVVERLLPPPEAPLPKPGAPPPEPPPAESDAGAATAPDTVEVAPLAPPPPVAAAIPEATPDASLASPPPARPPARFPVQIGAWSTRAEAERGWREARRRAPELLASVEHAILAGEGGAGPDALLRLQVGPLPTRERAKELCRRLRGAGVACFVAVP